MLLQLHARQNVHKELKNQTCPLGIRSHYAFKSGRPCLVLGVILSGTDHQTFPARFVSSIARNLRDANFLKAVNSYGTSRCYPCNSLKMVNHLNSCNYGALTTALTCSIQRKKNYTYYLRKHIL